MKSELIRISGGGYCATVNVSRGANCISLRHECGASLLREPKDPDKLDNPFLYGMPVLFPVNRISGGKFVFEGRQYSFPINEPATGCHLHGFLHETPFCVTAKSVNAVTCLCRVEENTLYPGFPHAFTIEISYQLNEKGLTHTVSVTNLSQKNMPCLLGFHTTFLTDFCRAGIGQTRLRMGIGTEYARNMKNYLPTGETPQWDRVSQAISDGTWDPTSTVASRHYATDGGSTTVLYHQKADMSLVYRSDKKFPFRLLYNGNADEFVCAEPQTSLANSPNGPFSRKEGGFTWLEPGARVTYTSQISLEKGDLR